MREAGATTSVIRGVGGGLSSELWRQIMVDVLGVGLQLAGSGSGAARGAAVLGGLGIGLYRDADVGLDWSARGIQTPDPSARAVLDPNYRLYRELYPRLRGLSGAVGAEGTA